LIDLVAHNNGTLLVATMYKARAMVSIAALNALLNAFHHATNAMLKEKNHFQELTSRHEHAKTPFQ